MKRFVLISVLSSWTTVVMACTTWASIGQVNHNQGVLVVKNRDGSHHSREQLRLVKPLGGYPYLGLVYNTTGYAAGFPYLSAGINRYDLTVVNNAAGTTPTTDRDAGETRTMATILSHYRSVAQVLKDQRKLFTTDLVNNLILADRHRIALIEMGQHGLYCIWSKTAGYLYHTNQFECKKLQAQNIHAYPDSITRYQTIGNLLKTIKRPFTFDEFYTLTNRQMHGLNASLFRKWTDATWIVAMPKKGPATLYVRFTDPVQPYHVYRLTLSTAFWQQKQLQQIDSQ